jgi:hypothetical protein
MKKARHAERYHAPSDDANQPVNLGAAADYEEVIRALTVAVADDQRGSRIASFDVTPRTQATEGACCRSLCTAPDWGRVELASQ